MTMATARLSRRASKPSRAKMATTTTTSRTVSTTTMLMPKAKPKASTSNTAMLIMMNRKFFAFRPLIASIAN